MHKFLENQIKLLHRGQTIQTEIDEQNDSNKNSIFIFMKTRNGYIYPFSSSYIFSDNNDYSDSSLIKIKIENKELRYEYSYYIVTNLDYVIENISSSAINLELSLDLLKKYLVKIDILIRTEQDSNLNTEKYSEYEEEPKEITWVFPYMIYPKDIKKLNKEEEIENLITKSKKKKYNMQIKIIKINGNDNIAFLFKINEITQRNNKIKLNNDIFIPKSDKKMIMFYLTKLKYTRTYVVDKKTGFNNLIVKSQEENNDNTQIKENNKLEEKKNKKYKKSMEIIFEDLSSDNSERVNKNILTKEKILNMQVLNSIEIKNFIYSLPLYGLDISLDKFRPNGDRYSASKITESRIKIQLNLFCKRIDEQFKIDQKEKKKRIHNLHEHNVMESNKTPKDNNQLFSTNESSLSNVSMSNPSNQGEDLNKGLKSDSISTFSNIFKVNTIKYIKILITFSFLITFIMLLFEFIITYQHIKKLEKKIIILKNSCDIFENMLFTKHFVTQGIISNSMNDLYFPVKYESNLTNYLNNIIKELSINRQKFTEAYNTISTYNLCKKYSDSIYKTKLEIYTLTLGSKTKLPLLLNNAMNRISSSIYSITLNPSIMKLDNRDTYELMYNLLNEYYLKWQQSHLILLSDSSETTKFKIPLLIILLLYLFISIIIVVIFLKLLARFSLDREKPINLLLTLKKVVFENLKNSSENFSNKLLNKFFGNEENDEDSKKEYHENIHPKDINIIKFKAVNETSLSINKAFDFLEVIFIILIFLLINLIYFLFKYFEFRKRMANIEQFILLFDYTSYAYDDFVLSFDVFFSFFLDKSIPILNNKDTEQQLLKNFLDISNQFEISIIYNTKTKSFLSGEYFEKYKQYLLGNYEDLLDEDFLKIYKPILENTIIYGIKPIVTKIYENMRYFTLKFYNSENDIKHHSLFVEHGSNIYEMNLLLESIIKKWFNGVLDLMINSFYDYMDEGKLNYIIFSIILLNGVLKKSFDLINLIPQEIKELIIEKLNE